MVKSDERMKVLKMVADGKISATEAAQLLEALEDAAPGGVKSQAGGPAGGTGAAAGAPRWFRVRVTDSDTGRVRVNVRLPLGVVNAGLKLGMKFAPQVEGLDVDHLTEMINSGEIGQIADIFDEKDGEHVEVFIE